MKMLTKDRYAKIKQNLYIHFYMNRICRFLKTEVDILDINLTKNNSEAH